MIVLASRRKKITRIYVYLTILCLGYIVTRLFDFDAVDFDLTAETSDETF